MPNSDSIQVSNLETLAKELEEINNKLSPLIARRKEILHVLMELRAKINLTIKKGLSPSASSTTFNEIALDQSIESLDLTVSTKRILRNERILTVGELVEKSEVDLLKMPNVGRKILNEIKAILESAGFLLKPMPAEEESHP